MMNRGFRQLTRLALCLFGLSALGCLESSLQECGDLTCPSGLVCAPIESQVGREYLGTMRAAANFAWCNRQLLMWQAREVFEAVFGRRWQDIDMQLIYDVAHNIAKP